MRAVDQHALNEALTKLETSLLTPVVSGELASWVRAVQQAAGDVGTQLKAYLTSTQRSQYRQIASSDPELLARVQQLAREDQELLAEFAGLEKNLERLAQLVAAADKDESRAAKQRSELEQQGTATILRIRKQQVAANTWLSEAVYRDRGVAD